MLVECLPDTPCALHALQTALADVIDNSITGARWDHPAARRHMTSFRLSACSTMGRE